ncbi:MAG: methionyl-tRNA formyltransferase [Bacteroidetes bacterium]|nr:methionyl-tRNA formyltransferase [Bacteroidota bacterium]
MRDLRIVFVGTPEFAVPSLSILVQNGYRVVGVITTPDKPSGRGQKLSASPVKKYCEENKLKILQPNNLKNTAFIEELKSLKANLQVVVAFRMLPEIVWNMPEYGTFNLHASLLPQYRGSAPINWAIINGEKETGVTTFFLQHEIDTGSIIFQDKEMITDSDTTGTLYKRLMHKGAKLVLKTVKVIAQNKYTLTVQNESQVLNSAPKIVKNTCRIDWTRQRDDVYNFIRGLSPYPGAWTYWNRDTILKIFRVSKSGNSPSETRKEKPGEIYTDNKNFIMVNTGSGWLNIEELQMQGKKRMNVADFVRGNKIIAEFHD